VTDEEFRADLLAASAARAEAHETSLRDGFAAEILERLRDAGEVPDAESCAETLTGQSRRRLEVDAFAFDDADDSLHLFVTMRDGGPEAPPPITLTEARDQGFSRLLGVFEQARDGWLAANIEESRPLWALARRIQVGGRPAALRLHVITDRPMSERLREIKADQTKEGLPVTFQIWDVTRLKRIHEAQNVRDDLFVDLSELPGGGLTVLPAAVGLGDYDAYLAVVPGEALADIYIEHGSRLLEGNVRTYLGRRGNINRGIAATLSSEPARFFAYNNGIAATASEVRTVAGPGGTIVLTGVADLQIVNGAQTTASLASLRRDGKLPKGAVSVPMKLSVVAPAVAEELIPRISRFANTQNTVRASDFFANHAFHRRMEEISRRILAPAVSGSLTQTHWYYERARGQASPRRRRTNSCDRTLGARSSRKPTSPKWKAASIYCQTSRARARRKLSSHLRSGSPRNGRTSVGVAPMATTGIGRPYRARSSSGLWRASSRRRLGTKAVIVPRSWPIRWHASRGWPKNTPGAVGWTTSGSGRRRPPGMFSRDSFSRSQK
jgi:hypothetical protein